MAVAKRAIRMRRAKGNSEAPPVPEDCSRFVRVRVAEALPVICESLLEKAKRGDATALRALWQMAGLAKAAEESSESVEDSDRRGAAFALAALKKFGSGKSEPKA